jgi:molybdopterin biosynthesis enzyme
MSGSTESEIYCAKLGAPCPELIDVQVLYGENRKKQNPDDHSRFVAIANGHFVDREGEDCTVGCALSMLTATRNLDHLHLIDAQD